MSSKALRAPLLYPPVHYLIRVFHTLMGGYRVEGLENIPKAGPVIIVPNHVSMVDPPLIAITFPRTVKIMAKIELFKVPIIGPLIAHLGAFPVHRGQPDRAALKKAIDYLNEGWPVLIFPEGTRGDGVELGPLEKGVLLIANKTGAPIVPAYISGTLKMLPRGAKGFRRSRVKVRYGPPIDPKSYGKGGDLGAAIMGGIAALKE